MSPYPVCQLLTRVVSLIWASFGAFATGTGIADQFIPSVGITKARPPDRWTTKQLTYRAAFTCIRFKAIALPPIDSI